MILKNELYTIEGRKTEGTAVSYDLHLNSDHFIYQAHFPGEPITPGVCIIQMAKELLEDYCQRPLQISEIKIVKFMAVISPVSQSHIQYFFDDIQSDESHVTAVVDVKDNDQVMCHLVFTCKNNIGAD